MHWPSSVLGVIMRFEVFYIMFPIQQQDGDRNTANAAVDDLAVHSIRGLLIHIRLAGINAEQAILGQHIQPVGIHGLGGICRPISTKKP